MKKAFSSQARASLYYKSPQKICGLRVLFGPAVTFYQKMYFVHRLVLGPILASGCVRDVASDKSNGQVFDTRLKIAVAILEAARLNGKWRQRAKNWQ